MNKSEQVADWVQQAYERGYEQGRTAVKTEKEDADGCTHCKFFETETWEMPCVNARIIGGQGMTNKESKAWLISIKERYIHGGDEGFDNLRNQAIDLAIEAIQNQEILLDLLADDYMPPCTVCNFLSGSDFCTVCDDREDNKECILEYCKAKREEKNECN